MSNLGEIYNQFSQKYIINANAVVNYREAKTPATVITVNDRAATREAIIKAVRAKGHKFTTRSDWKAVKGKAETLDWDYTMIAIHHAGRSYSCGVGGAQMLEIQQLHMKEKKNEDVGYHYAISCDGEVFEGRDIRYKGEHLNLYNSYVIGIVLLNNQSTWSDDNIIGKMGRGIGYIDKSERQPLQVEGLKILVAALKGFFNISTLGGHKEYPNNYKRSCPGSVGMEIVNELRNLTGLAAPEKL